MNNSNSLKPFILCIGREIGAGGLEAAHALSKTFGATVYDKDIISHAARESGIAPELFEKADESASRNIIGGLFGLGISLPGGGAIAPGGGYLCNENLFRITSQVMHNLASAGSSIFVGRCADYVLRDLPNVFSVFLSAKMEDRIARLCPSHGITEKEARSIIEETDKKRADYYNYYTFKKWGAAASYDMCLNTSVIGMDKTLKIIESVIISLFSEAE